MNKKIQTVKQFKLIDALKRVPKQSEVTTQEQLNLLLDLLDNFQLEVERNIRNKNSYSFSIDYVYQLMEKFKNLYITVDGSFEILLFPEIIKMSEQTNVTTIKKTIDSHRFIYLRVLSMLKDRETLITKKIKFKIPIVEQDEVPLSKYLLNEYNLTNWVEVGLAIYDKKILNTRIGDKVQEYQFIRDFCLLVGEEKLNVKSKLEEVRNRANPHRFLDGLVHELKKYES
jgi:hypothetical protein